MASALRLLNTPKPTRISAITPRTIRPLSLVSASTTTYAMNPNMLSAYTTCSISSARVAFLIEHALRSRIEHLAQLVPAHLPVTLPADRPPAQAADRDHERAQL